MKFDRILSFSPTLTFNVAQDGNFYPPFHHVTGLSPSVHVEHSHIEIGKQVQLYSIAEEAVAHLVEIGANSDAKINKTVCTAIFHAERVRAKALDLLNQNGVIAGHSGLTRERLLALWPDDLIRIAIKDEIFGVPKDYLSLCLVGTILHLVDATLCALQNKPTEAVEPAMRAAHCLSAVLSLDGWNILGGRHPAIAGGQSKRERSERVAKYACSLVEGKTYRSRAEAVRQIKQRVIDFAASEENWTMSVNQADTTIAGWLAAQGLPLLAG
ncbi:hypothetical protein [Burkholderia glumae]|uniref:hypothetical protein n=1 Tax=Burkholderia glumae TaxID=337 RepID=UPI0004250885|nr:hypothetical protein [Burkholderia glumae]QKM53746.1 hypothetical protein CG017_01763 [Burkholderia glumae]